MIKKNQKMFGNDAVRAVLDAWPNTAQVVTSPITGDPDPNNDESICNVQHIATGFLLPKAGYIDEIHFIAQGNTGAGVNRNIRYSVVEVTHEPAAQTGLKHNSTLATGVTPVADNVSGDVTVAVGLNLAVPSQFVIALKGPARFNSEAVRVQNCLSAGPVPGVLGIVPNGNVISAATYAFNTTDLDVNTPGEIVAGDKLSISTFKGLTVYIKWRGE